MDLIVSSYQLWEARAAGADLVLLTAAALRSDALESLVERAASLGLTAVVDVRDGADLMLALSAAARAVLVRQPAQVPAEAGRAALCDLLSMIPDSVVRVAECGPAGRSDLIAYARKGADAVLLGRALLAGGDPRATVTGLAAIGAHPSLFRPRMTGSALPR
jgi:indole-3-glycerol phosphate synthase